MEREIRLVDLIPRPEMTEFLRNLGEALDSRCAILSYPSAEECKLLEEYSPYLRQVDPEAPADTMVEEMWKGLQSLGNEVENPCFGRSEFCDLLRISHLADLRCAYSNYFHAKEAYERKTSILYVCHAGLYDMVAPLVIADRHEADLFIGQNHRDLTEGELCALHTKYQLGRCSVSPTDFMAAYKKLLGRSIANESPATVEDRLSRRSRLLAELARLLSLYATRRLADLIFSGLWTRVHANQTPNEVMADVMRALRAYVRFDSSGVWTRNLARPGWLTCLFSDYSAPGDTLSKEGMRDCDGLGGQVITSGKTVHLKTGAGIDQIAVPPQYRELRAQRGLSTFLAVPLQREGQTTGFVEIGSRREYAFWPGTVAMMEEVARYLSLLFALRSELAYGYYDRTLSPEDVPKLSSVAYFLVHEIPKVLGCLGCSVFSLTDDGHFLQCEATTGILGLESTSVLSSNVRYAVDADQLTPWAFRYGKTVSVKSRAELPAELQEAKIATLPIHREVARSPLGIVLGAAECDRLPVIVTPIFVSGAPRGVLRIVGRAGGGAFTSEECLLAEQLASTLAHPDSVRRRLVRILGAAPSLLGALDADMLYYYFLTLITHGEAVGINRAILLDYDATDSSLRPVAAIGPANPHEASILGPKLSREAPNLESCFAVEATNTKPGRDSSLFRSLPSNIVLSHDSAIARVLAGGQSSAAVQAADPGVLAELTQWLPALEVKAALCCGIRVGRLDRRFLLICDNVYTGLHFNPAQASLLSIVASLFQRGIQLLTREHDFDALKSRSWRQAVDTIAHNLGNKMPFIEDGLVRAIERPALFENAAFGQSLLERVRSAMRDVGDLRRTELPVEPTRMVRISWLLKRLEEHLTGESQGRATVRWRQAQYNDDLLRVDSDRLLECCSVLYRNAADLGLEKLVLDVETSVISFSAEPGEKTAGLERDRRYLRLILRDNGPGVPVNKKHRIFDPYYSDKPGGEGLGLSFVAQVFARHGGLAEEVGEYGKGAAFALYLPLAESEGVTQQRSTRDIGPSSVVPAQTFTPELPRGGPVGAPGSTWRTLVVEDDDYVAWKVVERFRELKVRNRLFEFSVVPSLDKYLQMQRDHLFDVVILDMSLFESWPERTRDLDSGLDVAEYLRVWNAGAVVVVYSASLTVDIAVRAMRSGAFDCVDKNHRGSLAQLVRSVEAGIESTWVSHESLGQMISSLSAEFPGQYVAVEGGEVLGAHASLPRLKERLRRERPEAQPMFIHIAGDA